MGDFKQIVPQLMLDTKIQIPFPSAQISINQPSIEDIAFIGEDTLIIGCKALTKDYSAIQDNFDESKLTNFQILMRMISGKSEEINKVKESIEQILFLLFPDCNIRFTPASIIIQDDQKQVHMIDSNNFDIFANIIYDMFCLGEFSQDIQDDYNPLGDRARAIADKFKKKRELLAKMREERGESEASLSIFGRYLNILATGASKDKNMLKKYSVYQLIEEFNRFNLKETFDYTCQARLAGATKIKDPKDWTQNVFGIDSEN